MSFSGALVAAAVPGLAIGVLGWIGIVVAAVVIGVAGFLLLAAVLNKPVPVRDQRPFYICTQCTAYNSRHETRCWRCEQDLTTGAVEPHGQIGKRLETLEREGAAKS